MRCLSRLLLQLCIRVENSRTLQNSSFANCYDIFPNKCQPTTTLHDKFVARNQIAFVAPTENSGSREMVWFRKLNRRSEHRMAMLKNQVTSLIKHGAITTTFAKAKELQRIADWMVTWGKKGYVQPDQKCDGPALRYRRMANVWVKEKEPLRDLFQELPVRFATRRGGYTRVLRLGNRLGDGAEIARIEWVEWDNPEDQKRFEQQRKIRAEKHLEVRQACTKALRENWNTAGLASLRSIGKALNIAENKTDIKKLTNLYKRKQSAHDTARSMGKEAKPAYVKPPLASVELPPEYKVVKVVRNPFNKFGGRGLALVKKPAENQEGQ